MLILTQRQDLILQVQLLASVQTFQILTLRASCTETKRFLPSAKTLQWHLVSEKNSKTDSSDQSEFA
jgi:hypothetical protein